MTTDMPTVEIFCCEPSHDGVRYVICRFGLDAGDDGGPALWSLADSWVEPGQPSSGRLRGARAVSQLLVGDRYVPRDERRKMLYHQPRSRYSFRCDVCGFSWVKKAEVVWAALDRLAAAGVPSVSLTGLAANV